MFTQDETVVRTCYLGSDLQKTLVEECIGEINVRKGHLVCGVRAILRPDVTLDFGHGVCILRMFLAPDIAGDF